MKNKALRKAIAALLLILSLLFVSVSGCSSDTGTGGEQTFEVKRGDLDVIVSADGSMNMPDTFGLSFGTMGTVEDILVEEGDSVRQGAILAFLDSTAQINAIKTSLFNVRSAVNSLTAGANGTDIYTYTVTIPAHDECQCIGGVCVCVTIPAVTSIHTFRASTCAPGDIPNAFPELSAVQIFEEAQKDLDEFISYFNEGQYKDAGFKLGMIYFDIRVCEELIKTRVDPAVLAGAGPNTLYYPDGTAGTGDDMSSTEKTAVAYLEKLREDLLGINWSMMNGEYEWIAGELDTAQQNMVKGKQLVENTVHHRGRDYLTYPDIPTSLDFLQASLRTLEELDKYAAQDGAREDEMAKKIYLAKLNLQIGSDILENETVIYDLNSGFNWKSLQQYNLSVQSAEIAFYKAKRDIMNTAIIAPVDGEVVSVDLKKDYVLSAQDYASRSAIQLVDTQKIKFTGMVDEIDIMKVQIGQKAEIAVDAIPDKKFTGTVKFISPFGTLSGQVIKFAVTNELDPMDVAELRGGLTATADINTYSAKNVLLVPTTAIITTPVGAMVTVINEATGQQEPRKVTLGKQNFQYAEVLEGLKEGEKILLSNQAMNPGQFPGAPVQGGSMRMLR